MALLAVRDNGRGVDPRDLGHIFDPFYRSRSANGAGAVSASRLAREIVRRHGGDVRAANRSAGGCEIQVRLPLAIP